MQARTLLLSRNLGVQNLNGVNKVGDQHPDLLRRLSRRNATLSPKLTLMFHFIPRDCSAGHKPEATVPSDKEASKEDAVSNRKELKKFHRCYLLPRDADV
jgi:hypothetical protein